MDSPEGETLQTERELFNTSQNPENGLPRRGDPALTISAARHQKLNGILLRNQSATTAPLY
jgi:hypothetical protein